MVGPEPLEGRLQDPLGVRQRGPVVMPSDAESVVSQAKKRRLRLFGLGNDRCPICLRPFTKQAVEEGKTVTLEHVPPRSFNVRAIAMCLTCADCNHSAGRSEQVAVEAAHDEVKVRLDVAGLPPFTAHVAVTADERLSLRVLSRSDVPPGAFDEALREGRTLSMKGLAPTAQYVNVPWLKAAYLSVFSLLAACRTRKRPLSVDESTIERLQGDSVEKRLERL